MYRTHDVPRSSSPRRTSTPLRFRTATLLPSGDIIGTINVDAIIHRVAPFLPLSQVFPSFEDASLFEILLFESKEESRGGGEIKLSEEEYDGGCRARTTRGRTKL